MTIIPRFVWLLFAKGALFELSPLRGLVLIYFVVLMGGDNAHIID